MPVPNTLKANRPAPSNMTGLVFSIPGVSAASLKVVLSALFVPDSKTLACRQLTGRLSYQKTV